MTQQKNGNAKNGKAKNGKAKIYTKYNKIKKKY
jgi:hypothetical protein